MAEINIADAKMMYQDTLVLRKGIPIFIRQITDDGMVHAWHLPNQKFLRFRFKQADLSNPSFRLGYVNLGTNCFFLCRFTARIYKAGLNNTNIKSTQYSDHPLNRVEQLEASNIMKTLSSVSLYKTIKGIYPEIREAFRQATENKGVVAFDRQFAVSKDAIIFYKGKVVGSLVDGCVVLMESYAHLSLVLPKGVSSK